MKPLLFAISGAFFFSGAIGAFVKHSPMVGIPLGIALTIASIVCFTIALRPKAPAKPGEEREG